MRSTSMRPFALAKPASVSSPNQPDNHAQAATAAVLALEERKAVQGISYETLKKRLLADGQVVVLRK